MAGGAWFHWHWADLGLKRTDFFDFAHIRWLDLICFIGKKNFSSLEALGILRRVFMLFMLELLFKTDGSCSE